MYRIILLSLSIVLYHTTLSSQDRPNILILVADDMGADAFAPYNIGADLPTTPVLNSLVDEGLLFMNAWSYPTCAPSRASLITGRYGSKNGITRSGPNMDDSEITLFEHIDDLTNSEYANALLGKWHLGNANSPNNQGIDHYIGNISSGVDDYFDWERNINGTTDQLEEYVTTYITDQAITWLDEQTDPWFLWMAYNAPHGPIHLPPDSLYTRQDTSTNFDKYLCMIESVDHEVGRLLNSLSEEEKENTFILFVGDNGTPNAQLQSYPRRHGKGSVYEGGIRVPMFATGYGVDRVGQREEAMISFSDVFATITELLGQDLAGGMDNSFSFYPLLSDSDAAKRSYNYSEIQDDVFFQAIRNEQYKLVMNDTGLIEMYDLSIDSLEETDLIIAGLSTEQMEIRDDLINEADSIRYSWSCRDGIQNGDEEEIDCGDNTSCGACTTDVEILIEDSGVSIYPNPTEDDLIIELTTGSYTIDVIDIAGTTHSSFSAIDRHTIDVSSLPDGLYFLQIKNIDTNSVLVSKVIKE